MSEQLENIRQIGEKFLNAFKNRHVAADQVASGETLKAFRLGCHFLISALVSRTGGAHVTSFYEC